MAERSKFSERSVRRAEPLIRQTCQLAGSISFLVDIQAEAREFGLDQSVASHDTAAIYDWLMIKFSFQGISDQVARGYIAKHGSARWSKLQRELKTGCSCPRLRNYWQYEGCRYDKLSRTCAEPEFIDRCPVPRPRLRNGRLNQTAFSLFLFLRDIASGNLVRWIDSQLGTVDQSVLPAPDTLAARQEALIGPLRHVYGVSDKVLTMALSSLLMGVQSVRPNWFETGAAMVTIDTLVHNFLHRTGILQDCGTSHQFGAACYAPGGCAGIIRHVAARIDARQFNAAFPPSFPRFVQHSIWRYCAGDGLNICNGNQIDDDYACDNRYCRLGPICGRKPLK